MILSLLILLVTSFGVGVESISEEVLRDIVTRFEDTSEAGRQRHNQGIRQFSFLLVLQNCNNLNQESINLYYPLWSDNNTEAQKLIINRDLENMFKRNNELNYLAALPTVKFGEESVCTEYKILLQPDEGNTYARQLSDKLRTQPSRDSCVIFYTTNTPCLEKCFYYLEQHKYIVPRLVERPFSDWANMGAQLIFVFNQVYHCDTTDIDDIKEGFKDLQNRHPKWDIYRCPTGQNCGKCVENNHFCLENSQDDEGDDRSSRPSSSDGSNSHNKHKRNRKCRRKNKSIKKRKDQ